MIVSVKNILAIHERQCAIFYCHLPTDSAVELNKKRLVES